MKKTVAIFLALMLAITTIGFTAGLDSRLQSATTKSDIIATAMPLQELLDLIQKQSGIVLIAVPEIADLKIDLTIAADQTVAGALEQLQQKYGLANKRNPAGTAIVLFQGQVAADRLMFSGKAMPSGARA